MDFANILLSGPCNLSCPHCVGRVLPRRWPGNLDRFPLAGQDRFLGELRRLGVREVSLTGSDTEPMLYAHQPELLEALRADVPGVRISLHTNGTLLLKQPELFNRYDRATISLPSFRPETCRAMTGRPAVLDLPAILAVARIPVKISTLVTDDNRPELPEILAECRRLGVRRLVLRKLYGETREFDYFRARRPVRWFAGNPVYDLDGLEVTVWDFGRTALECLNLWSDGTVGTRYLLEENARERSGAGLPAGWF